MQRIVIEPRVCPVCGNLFTPRTSQLKTNGGKHCSLACLGISRRLPSTRMAKWVPVVSIVCSDCGTLFQGKKATLCRACITRKAGKRCRELHPLVGVDNPLWKGGISKDIKLWLSSWAKKYRKANPQKQRARDAAMAAIKSGALIRLPCADCGCSSEIQAHHADYSKPLDVIWLCRTCHNRRHGKLRDGKYHRRYLARKAKAQC
jgi:hypothetical protein